MIASLLQLITINDGTLASTARQENVGETRTLKYDELFFGRKTLKFKLF